MAKNWSMKEAVVEILAGNKTAIQDIGRRFPLTANAIATMGNNLGAITIINALPEHISVRKIESTLKDGVEELEDDEIETPEEKPVVEKEEKKSVKKAAAKAKKEETKEDDDLESMSEVELFKLCRARKIKAAPKQDKQYYLDLLNPKAEDSDDDDWDDEEVEEKPAKKAAPKKEVKKETKKAPVKKAAKEEESSDDEDDDWDI